MENEAGRIIRFCRDPTCPYYVAVNRDLGDLVWTDIDFSQKTEDTMIT